MLNKLLDNRYRIKKVIGEGGMACVYLAFDERLGRNVAVKVLHSHLSQDAEIRQRFHLEAKALSGTEHPNIINIYDFSGTDSKQLWIVTEILKGVNLAQYVQRFRSHRLHPSIAALIVAEVLKALDHAHGKGIIHRDIKPENVMILDSGQVKIMDFGISKNIHTNEMTRPGSFMGSPSYMSPEQIHGKDIDHRSDIYSVCVLFYEIVTGTLPFIGEGTADVINKILVGKYLKPNQIVPSLPTEINKIIVKGLHNRPERRFTSVLELLTRLRRVLQLMGFEESHIELERFFRDPQKFATRLNRVDRKGPAIYGDDRDAPEKFKEYDMISAEPAMTAYLQTEPTRKLAQPQAQSPAGHQSPAGNQSPAAPTKTRREAAPRQIFRQPPRLPPPPLPQPMARPVARGATQVQRHSLFTSAPQKESFLQWMIGVVFIGILALLIFWTVSLVILSLEQKYPESPAETSSRSHRLGSSVKSAPSAAPAGTSANGAQPETSFAVAMPPEASVAPAAQPSVPTAGNNTQQKRGAPKNETRSALFHGNKIVRPLPDARDFAKSAEKVKTNPRANPVTIRPAGEAPPAAPAKAPTASAGGQQAALDSLAPGSPREERTSAQQKTGHVMIVCDPPADVVIDQKHIGMTSQPPFMEEGAPLAVGAHTLRLTRQGYQDIANDFRVTAGETLKLDFKLLRKAVSVPLVIRSSHVPIRVTVRGLEPALREQKYMFNKKTNEILLVEGKYQISVEYGAKSIERVVMVSAANAMTFNAEFSSTP